MTLPELVPLPVGPALDELLVGARAVGISQGQRRRLRRQRGQEAWLREGVVALNQIAGVASSDVAPAASAAQRAVISSLVRHYAAAPPPPADAGSPLRAWTALQGTRLGYSDQAVAAGTRSRFERGMVSLPSGGAHVELHSLLPGHLQNRLNGEGLWRDCAEARSLQDTLGNTRFVDPALADHPRHFGEFVSDFFRRGLIEPTLAAKEVCGMFFVRKKDGSLRLIWDTRISNT